MSISIDIDYRILASDVLCNQKRFGFSSLFSKLRKRIEIKVENVEKQIQFFNENRKKFLKLSH